MIKSFHLRLALLSSLLSGMALVAFGLGTWWLIRDIKIDRIDNEVRAHAEREVNKARDAEGWARILEKIEVGLGIQEGSNLALLVQDQSGAVTFRSPHWPAEIGVSKLPWPSQFDPDRDRAPPSDQSHPREDKPLRNAPPLAADPRQAPSGAPERRQPPDGSADPGNPRPPRPPRSDFATPPGPPPASLVVSRVAEGQSWRIGLATSDRSHLAVAVGTRSIDGDMQGIRNAFLLAMPLALVLIGFGGWVFSRRALSPLQKLTAASRRVTAQGLDQRISSEGEDREFGELIEVFNGMLERLERSFNQAHRFSADAAHELKTPLAILQGQLERAIGTVDAGSPMQAELTSILDEVRRLSTISRKLLLLSQADAGRLNVNCEPFDLSKAVADLIEDVKMLAPHLRVTGEVHPNLVISADGGLLTQVLHNLISNAIKYNLEQGWVHFSTVIAPDHAEVRVANSSPGIPVGEQGKIFQRFYRADPAHSRHVEGVGLGLSVSREIARAHGGDITFSAKGDGAVQFSLVLPMAAGK